MVIIRQALKSVLLIILISYYAKAGESSRVKEVSKSFHTFQNYLSATSRESHKLLLPNIALRGGGVASELMDRPSIDAYGEAIYSVNVTYEMDSPTSNDDYNLTFLASTAGSIAAYRAAVTFLNSSYIDDPFAIMFARETNPEKLEAAKMKNASELARFAIRTRYFDHFVRDAVFRDGIRQV